METTTIVGDKNCVVSHMHKWARLVMVAWRWLESVVAVYPLLRGLALVRLLPSSSSFRTPLIFSQQPEMTNRHRNRTVDKGGGEWGSGAFQISSWAFSARRAVVSTRATRPSMAATKWA